MCIAGEVLVVVSIDDTDKVHYEFVVNDVTEGHKYVVRARSVSSHVARPSPWTDPITADIITKPGQTHT